MTSASITPDTTRSVDCSRRPEASMIHVGAHEVPPPIQARVDGLTTKVRKVTTTDEGKLQIVLEAEGMDQEALAQVKELLVLQQSSLVLVAMEPVQQELFE